LHWRPRPADDGERRKGRGTSTRTQAIGEPVGHVRDEHVVIVDRAGDRHTNVPRPAARRGSGARAASARAVGPGRGRKAAGRPNSDRRAMVTGNCQSRVWLAPRILLDGSPCRSAALCHLQPKRRPISADKLMFLHLQQKVGSIGSPPHRRIGPNASIIGSWRATMRGWAIKLLARSTK
jgi:hypothetical protein